MLDLSTLTDIRDFVIIVFGITALVALALFIVFTLLIGFVTWRLLRVGRRTLQDGFAPMLENAGETARGVRGTAAFVSESLVSPIISVYGLFAGVRRGVGVVTRRRGR